MAQQSTDLAKYTLVSDGQTEWYADTQELVAALIAFGYTYERYQGYDTVAEPEHGHDGEDGPDGGDPYSILCSFIDSVDESTVASDPELEVEVIEYEPATVGEHGLRVSRDLGFAVYEATP